MIRTSLIYLLIDRCLDKIFDPICERLDECIQVSDLKVGDRLNWVRFRNGDFIWIVKKAIVVFVDVRTNVFTVQRHRTGKIWKKGINDTNLVCMSYTTVSGDLNDIHYGRAIGSFEV